MPFVKRQISSKFTLIPNDILEDDDLGLKDVGLLCFLLHLPDDWNFSVEGLVSVLRRNGKASVMSGLNKLEESGYLLRLQARNDVGGFGSAVWVISDTKLTSKEIAEIASSYADYPSSDFPSSGFPTTGNQTQINTKETNTNKKKERKYKKKEDPDGFERFWEAYPRKVGKQAAKKAFHKLNDIPIDTLLSAVERQKASKEWTKDGGEFIPYPATWLNQERWEDELTYSGNSAQNAFGNTKPVDPISKMSKEELDRLFGR